MRHPPDSLMPLLLLSLVLLGGGGCNESSGGAGTPSKEPARGPLDERVSQLVGESDVGNRYPSTVMVFAPDSGTEQKGRLCSGVLMEPRLVLTAGHCVCMRQEAPTHGSEGKYLIDSSRCAGSATVTTVVYEPPARERGLKSRTQEYSGAVRPHPALKVLLDEQGRVVSSEADLAVIVLETPVEGYFPPVKVADTDVEVGESLVMVGFGSDEVLGTLGGKRRFRANAVTKVLGSGRVLFESPERSVYKGDSGGPCLRETRNGPVLVGISSKGLGNEASLTSTYRHRVWLDEEIQRAGKVGSPVPQDSP